MRSLSARLLLLTIVFVMLAEVLIFVPSVARFRQTYLEDRMEAAHLAVLVLEATPDGMVSEDLTRELLGFVGAHAVTARQPDGPVLMLMPKGPPAPQATIRPAQEGPVQMITEALGTLTLTGSRTVLVTGPSPRDPSVELEIVMEDGPLCAAIFDFAIRILLLSLAISAITATLVFLVLRRQLVGPLKRLTGVMTAFREAPEDQSRTIRPSARRDELGVAERELAAMQSTIREALTQRQHLAALGSAVARINHDLRGILSSALVVSDRLERSEDPEVRRIAPGILDAIDRAVDLCGRTLSYVGRDQPALELAPVALAPVIAEAAFGLPNGADVACRVPERTAVQADRGQLFRIFSNLFRNAAEAGAAEIAVEAAREAGAVRITVADDGPGLPPRALENLFKPFEGSARARGTGLGLSIARELARAHGGDLVLTRSDAGGTVFTLTLPDGPAP
jgi:signal transduction histidine kinase